MKTNLLKQLSLLLVNKYPDRSEREEVIKSLITKFQNSPYLKYHVEDEQYILFIKDSRKMSSQRRYNKSPFPLLQASEYFYNSIGGWDLELKQFGIRTRTKEQTKKNPSPLGNKIYLVNYNSLSSTGNTYLRRQYKRLEKYRAEGLILNYWKLCWELMRKSWCFKLSCLNSWKPRWYKEYTPLQLRQILNQLSRILNLQDLKTEIKNVWIESPLGKWRQLGIPNKGWRLYLHIQAMFISYIYEPHLDKEIYDGFIFNRGCKSWWENLIWSKKAYSKYSFIYELDLSSGFPNISLHGIKRALESDKLIPRNLINLLMTHHKSTTTRSENFPTFETFLEDRENEPWRKSCRSVHMGLGTSPILFVIGLHWALKQYDLNNKQITQKWYADDGTFFMTMKGLQHLLRNFFPITRQSYKFKFETILKEDLIRKVLNEQDLFKRMGLRIDQAKSGFVRQYRIWKTMEKPWSKFVQPPKYPKSTRN